MRVSARLLAVGAVASWVSMLATLFLVGPFTWPWRTAAFAFVVAWLGARLVSHDLVEKPARDVDEYELIVRARARNAGYWLAFFSLVVLSVFFYYFVERAEEGNADLLRLMPGLLLVVTLAIGAFPTLLVAWNTRVAED